MNFNYFSFGTVGPIKKGMSRVQLRSTLGEGFEEFKKTLSSVNTTDAYDCFGLHVYYDEGDSVKGVEFFTGSSFSWMDKRVLGESVLDVRRIFEESGEVLDFNSSGFNVVRLGLRFYAPDIGEEDAAVEAVYVVLN